MNTQNLTIHTVVKKCDGNCKTLAAQVRNVSDATINMEAVKSTLVYIATKIKEAAEKGKYSTEVKIHDHLDINNATDKHHHHKFLVEEPRPESSIKYDVTHRVGANKQFASEADVPLTYLTRSITTDAEYWYIIESLREEGFSIAWQRHQTTWSHFNSKYDKVIISW